MDCINKECDHFNTGTCILGIAKEKGECHPVYPKMTIENAIKSLGNIIEYWTYKPTEIETAKMAIKSLEKEIPKQVIKIKDISSQACPVCKHDVNGIYCSNCGQKLKY